MYHQAARDLLSSCILYPMYLVSCILYPMYPVSCILLFVACSLYPVSNCLFVGVWPRNPPSYLPPGGHLGSCGLPAHYQNPFENAPPQTPQHRPHLGAQTAPKSIPKPTPRRLKNDLGTDTLNTYENDTDFEPPNLEKSFKTIVFSMFFIISPILQMMPNMTPK